MKVVARRCESPQWQPERSGDRQRRRSCPQGAAGINAGAVLKDGVYGFILDGFQNKPNAANAGLQQRIAASAASGKRSHTAQPEERRHLAVEFHE
jgi:hypothetical protein